MGKSRSPVAVKTKLAKSYSAQSGKRVANDTVAMEYRFGDIPSNLPQPQAHYAELNGDNYAEFEKESIRHTFSNPHSLRAELATRHARFRK